MLSDAQVRELDEQGILRVTQAFDPSRAKAMEERPWSVLERKFGARPAEPSTWSVRHASGLQGLRGDGIFEAIGGARTQAALDTLIGPRQWLKPKHWGTVPGLLSDP
jgi:hypothetical protein